MKKVLATSLLLVSLALLGFITTAAIEAITAWGYREAIAEMLGFWPNAIVTAGCVIFGAAFLGTGVRMLGTRS
jgi:hypothetical protein